MFLDIVSIVIGIFVVLKGADFLTDGAVSLAQRAGIPEMVIGLTVVALGTSMPELFVSLTSAIQGTTDLAVANVVGSNIFNVLLIAGTAAAVAPMTISKGTVRRDIPVAVAASLILLIFGIYGEISRWAGALFVFLLISYMVYAIKTASADDESDVALLGIVQNAEKRVDRCVVVETDRHIETSLLELFEAVDVRVFQGDAKVGDDRYLSLCVKGCEQ